MRGGALALAVLAAACRRAPPAAPAQPPVFEEVSAAAGVDFVHFRGTRSSLLPEDMGSGVCFTDVDGDGRDDLFFVDQVPLDPAKRSGPARNALFLNRGDGTFAAVPSSAVPQGPPSGMGCLFLDPDGSGRRDLVLTGWEGTVYHRALGGGRFAEATAASGLGDPRWSAGACAADYDGDGRPDLYVPRYVDFRRDRVPARAAAERGGYTIPVALSPHAFPPTGSSLYRGLGGGRWAETTARAGVGNPTGKALQCSFVDLDQDGRPDLYVADDVTPDVLFRNRGGAFADATNEAWLGDVKSSMGLAHGDADGDGDEDMAVTQWIAHEKSLYLNLLAERRGKDAPGHRLHFADGNAAAGLGESTLDNVGWGVAFFDYDDDGRLDLMIANGSTFEDRAHPQTLVPQRLQLFHNEGDGTFREVGDQAGPAFRVPVNARGLAVADYDGDGRLDVAVSVNGGRALLLRNALSTGNHWLELSLRGAGAMRDAIGARVVLTLPDGSRRSRVVSAGGSYLSQHSFVVHFGLGKAARASRVEVLWPDGKRSVLTDVAADRRLEVAEGR